MSACSEIQQRFTLSDSHPAAPSLTLCGDWLLIFKRTVAGCSLIAPLAAPASSMVGMSTKWGGASAGASYTSGWPPSAGCDFQATSLLLKSIFPLHCSCIEQLRQPGGSLGLSVLKLCLRAQSSRPSRLQKEGNLLPLQHHPAFGRDPNL